MKVYLLYPAVLLGWSLMGVASGLSHGATSLLICRIFLGFFEAGHWPWLDRPELVHRMAEFIGPP